MFNISSMGGTLIVFGSTVVAIFIVQMISRKTIKKSNSWPYQRQLVTIFLVLVGFFLGIGLLPIPHESKNQLLSVMGLVLTAIIALSSTTLVGNTMAGIMLRLMHEFRAGDFIEVDGQEGRVTDLGIFHTEIQLITRDVVSLPNLLLVQKPVKVTRNKGTLIHAMVTLGFSINHREAEAILKTAAESCSLTESFVFVEALLDHAVRYKLYGYLEESQDKYTMTSELHKAVLDAFHSKNVEIASPSLVDRREYPLDFHYIPKGTRTGKEKGKAPVIEKVAFDKAEEAKDIEQLKQTQEELVQVLVEKKETGEVTSKKKKEAIVEKIDKIKEEITVKEKEKVEKKNKGE
jgi:small-conductance mechanosensitive channel